MEREADSILNVVALGVRGVQLFEYLVSAFRLDVALLFEEGIRYS